MRVLPFLVAFCVLPILGLAAPAPSAAPALVCDPACDARVLDAASEPTLALHPDGSVLVAANSYTLGGAAPCGDGSARNVWPAFARSTDQGRTWTSTLLPQHPADATGLLSAFPCSRHPALAADPQTKRILVVAVGSAPAGLPATGLWAQQSYDAGATWDQQLVLAGAGAMRNEGPSMSPDAGGAGIIGDNGPNSGVLLVSTLGGDLMLSKNLGVVKKQGIGSLDSHLSWETDPALDLEPPPSGVLPNTTIYAGAGARAFNDASHTFYAGWTDGNGDVQEAHSLDFGITFEGTRRAGHITPFDASAAPVPVAHHASFAVDNAPTARFRWIYAAWADGPTPRIVASVSTDLGHAFGTAVPVSDAGAPGLRFAPSLAAGPDGTVWAAWYDTRDDPSGRGVAVYAALTKDGGVSWSPDARVSPVFDARLALDERDAPDLGEHLGLAVDAQGVAHVAWTDARDGHAAVYTARLTR